MNQRPNADVNLYILQEGFDTIFQVAYIGSCRNLEESGIWV